MALIALQRAVVHRRPPRGLIIHSDRGVQYACTAFAKWVNDHGFVQSMSRKGDCWDNAVAESFFHLLKTELTYHETLARLPGRLRQPVRIYRDLLQPRKEAILPWTTQRQQHSSYIQPGLPLERVHFFGGISTCL